MASSFSSNSYSSHLPRTKYDVFISFRGEDIRTSFLSHLVKEFRSNQIDFYVDDTKLHPGDEISSTLLQAIEESFILLVVFSKHYASSRWCMEELVKIVECMDRDQRIVIPIFYNVDPSDIRHQKRTFGEAFDIHQEKLEETMVKVWRSTLKKAANLSGFHYPSKYQNESKFIEEIVKDVSEKLSHIFTNESKGLVGMEDNFKFIESLLAIESNEVRILGIWGMGGIGKTTIAEAIFDKYSSQYEGCCFLKNVKEELQKYGLQHLCEKLVFELLDGENLHLKGPAKTRSAYVKRRLSRKKVFIVLDDVDTFEKLEHLTKEQICLGPGSRVIVTTRDKQILGRAHGIYEVQRLNFESSLQLFCLNAFGKDYPEIDYEKLSKIAVDYANGVPLALKVLGSFLYSRSIEAWESALRKLKICPNIDIFNVLKVSYDGLDDSERNIFLDIAFFYKGIYKDDVIRILDSCGFFADIGIDSLQRKSLITISEINTIEMHDLIEQMGWEIVRQESTKDPGKRSRLRNPEDVYNGKELVEGIILDLSQTRDLHLKVDSFKNLHRLRFLKLYTPWNRRSSNVYVPTTLETFSDELRYLEWSRYPLKSLPSAFCAEKLVEFRLLDGQVSKLWDGAPDLVNLKKINLSGCRELVELPDFSKAKNLEGICLNFCESLRQLHPSILSIHALKKLFLWHCKELKSFKGEIQLKSPETLNPNDCSSLEEFSMSLEELSYLDLGVTGLRSLPNELCFLMSLGKLNLYQCKDLTELPHNMKALSRLKSLELRGCCRLRSIPELPPFIIKLYAEDCTSLETIFSLKAVFSLNRMMISFGNCIRLDKYSLNDIMEDAQLTIFRNVLVRLPRLYKMWKNRYSDIRGSVCYPGSKVPEWYRCQTTQASISVELDQPYHQLMGFFVCCVISQELPISYGGPCHISCKYYLGDGEKGMYGAKGQYNMGGQWNSDHVCMWYDPYGSEEILEHIKRCRASDHRPTCNPKISFRFTVKSKVKVRPEKREKREENFNFAETCEHDPLVKGCGVLPIYASDVLDIIQKLELELRPDDKSKIWEHLGKLDLDALKREMILMMKEEPVPQCKIIDLASSPTYSDSK